LIRRRLHSGISSPAAANGRVGMSLIQGFRAAMISNQNHSRSSLAEAAEHLYRLPAGNRAGATLWALRCEPDDEFALSLGIPELRSALAASWEQVKGHSIPVETVQQLLGTQLDRELESAFAALDLTTSRTSLALVVEQLIREIAKRSRDASRDHHHSGCDRSPCGPPSNLCRDLPQGRIVSNLRLLIDEGYRFSTIYADPPWNYDNRASRAAAVDHYPTMTVEEICAEPVAELVNDKAHLHLWTTNAFLRDSFRVMDAWGFQYKSCLIWIKDKLGMGNYWRVSHEYLLLGVRGSLTFSERNQRSWILAPRTKHSRKPAVVRQLVEQVSPGPYLELYGREDSLLI